MQKGKIFAFVGMAILGGALYFGVQAGMAQEAADVTPPTLAAGGITASNITASSVTLTWAAATDNVGVTGYKLFRNNYNINTITELTRTDTGLTANTTYSYFIKAIDAAGNESAPSAAATITTTAPTCDGLTLKFTGPPDGKTSYIQGESVNYTYTCIPSGTQAANTAVQVVMPNGTATTYNNGANIGTASLGFSTSNLDPGTYTLRVCLSSTCASGTIAASNTFVVTASSTPTSITLTGTVFKDGQYIDPGTGSARTCVSPNAWMKEGPTATSARGFHCMPNYTPIATDSPPTPCTGTLYTTSTGGFTGDYCSTTVPAATTGSTTPPTSSTSCVNGTKCERGSWCQNGSRFFYPDGQITCVEWPAAPASTPIAAPPGTSLCDPSDANCVAPGQTVSYSSGKSCTQSQQYYSSDGINMTCVNWSQTPPAGYSVCRPSDTSCIPENSYGPSSGNCMNAMKCYQKTTDTDPRNDAYCAKMSPMTTSVPADSATCPSGYSFCSPTDTNCKQKGDAWTDSNTAYNCMNSQKCVSPSGGGSCVGWSESCPAGSKYCSATDTYCVEPGEYKSISTTSASNSYSNYWCGGMGGGMVFYSSTQAYCERKAGASTSTPMSMMWTAEDVKAVLAKLGSGWGFCMPGTRCIEPGKTGPSDGWCGWTPPNSTGSPSPLTPGSTRTCPALDATTVPPPPVCPAVTASKCQADEKPGVDANGCYTGVCTKKPICIAVTATVCPSGEEHGPSVADSNGCYLPGPCRKKTICPLAPSVNSCPAGQTLKTTTGDCPMSYCVNENEMRECAAGEISSPGNMCMWPMYRWIYADKQFEKCSRNSDPRIMHGTTATSAVPTGASTTAPMRPGTSCQPMNYELELKWKTMKYTVHPPEKDGEYWWPQWDASFDRLQYNPRSDQLEACSAKEKAPYMTGPMNTADACVSMFSCQPVPPQDKEWMLEMYRSQYKMCLSSSDQWKKQPGPGPEPVPVPVPQPLPIPAPDPGQCRPYLNGVRKGLVDDKQFWRDVNRKFADVKSTYGDAAKVSDLLAKAKALIISIDVMAKKGNCTIIFQKIPTDLETLHTDIFSDLSGYLTDMEEIGDLAQCRNRVEGLAKEVNQMMVDADDDETQAAIKDFAARIEEKIQGFEEAGDELGFDAGFDCESFVDEIDSQLNSFRIKLNGDTGRVSQSVLEKLGIKVETLTNDLADKSKKMDELIVQVAQLQKQVETFSKVASEVSDKLVVSYKALADMGERFKEDRQQILAEKNKLASLVEETLRVMHDTSCVRAVERDQMARELGDIATINWVPGRGEQLEKRLQLIMSSCRAKDFTQQDMASFFASLSEAERANLAESCRLGFTPFCDVPTHVWFYGGMVNAYENGYMTKGMPGENALAQDALLMVLRASGATESDVTGNCTLSAPEVRNVSPYAVCAVNYAYAKGLPLQGDMTQPVERIRIAQWITLLKPNLPKRADEAVDFDSFADIRSLGNGTRFVAYMYANGIMNGRVLPDGKTRSFDPHVSLTRAALAVILEQLRTVAGDSGNQPG